MGKFRFREYDALGIRTKLPGDTVPSAHHISKHKLKQKDVEVVFDVKDYKDYVTGFRKRKQQRRQDAMKQIKEKQRQDRNQQRSEKRTKLKAELGLGDDYGVQSSSDDDEENDASAQPQSVTVYQGEGGMTTTVTTRALQSSDDEQPEAHGSDGEDEVSGEADTDGEAEERGPTAGPGPSSGRREAAASRGAGTRKSGGKHGALRREHGKATLGKRPGGQGASVGGGKRGNKGGKGIDKKRRRKQ